MWLFLQECNVDALFSCMLCTAVTCSWISQLSTDHKSIFVIPVLVTNSLPLSINTVFNSSCLWNNPISQPHTIACTFKFGETNPSYTNTNRATYTVHNRLLVNHNDMCSLLQTSEDTVKFLSRLQCMRWITHNASERNHAQSRRM